MRSPGQVLRRLEPRLGLTSTGRLGSPAGTIVFTSVEEILVAGSDNGTELLPQEHRGRWER